VNIEELEGVTPAIASRLRDAGINTVENLITYTIDEVAEILGVKREEAERIMIEAWKAKGYWFTPAIEIARRIEEELVFTTGSRAFDELLGGGVRTRQITELIGRFGVGKTQTAYTILVEALGSNSDITAVFFDSERSFRDRRLREIAALRGYDSDNIMKRITVVPVLSSHHLMETIKWADKLFQDENVKILVIDSIIAPFRTDYLGRELLAPRQQMLNKTLRMLLQRAETFNMAVVVTNQVVSSPEQTYSYDPLAGESPAGGNILAHASQERIHIRKGKGNVRIARLIDSSWLPPGECMFVITDRGVEDVPEKRGATKKTATS